MELRELHIEKEQVKNTNDHLIPQHLRTPSPEYDQKNHPSPYLAEGLSH